MSSNINIKRVCKHCNTFFTAKTTITKYCSDLCRVTANRLLRQNPISVTADVTAETTTKYGKNDYTRKMVEDRIKNAELLGDKWEPNWYKLGFESKEHFKSVAWANL